MDNLRAKLNDLAGAGTPAERKLARYFLDNLNDLPFETAASIAEKMRVSPMTVGRFLRRLGYQGHDALKAAMRGGAVSSAWQITDRIDVLRRDLADGSLLADLMTEQIETLHRIYEMSNQKPWTDAVSAILTAQDVFVASYQNIGGIARYFTEQLAYARPRVRYMDGLNGTYVELLDKPPQGSMLILIDTRRYASKSRLLAQAASRAGHPVVVVTDQYCDWLDPRRHHALVLPVSRFRVWDCFMSLAALLDFLVTSVVIASGDESRARTERIALLQDMFGDFDKR